jgi:hypothetical protein
VTALIGHDDPPNALSPPPPQGARYSLGLAASGSVIRQVMASLVRYAFASFEMKTITRHSETIPWAVGTDDRCAEEVDLST